MQPLLKIDLTTRKTEIFNIPEAWLRDYIGGASLGAKILYPYMTKDLAPFSSQSPLLFVTGPLTGTLGPAVGRFVVCGKSPATNLWAESNCGGFWGPQLRFSGFDGLLITGVSQNPIYISIINGVVNFHEGQGMWGSDTYQVQEMIKNELGKPKASILGIGVAGERQVVFSGLFCDHGRTAGRTGLGAVMGSKKLKAIAVFGNHPIPIADSNAFNPIRSEANRYLKDDLVSQVVHKLGTAGVADYSDYLGIMPKKYYSKGEFSGSEVISGSLISETILKGTKACHGCVIACGRVVDTGDGVLRKGPEYESLVSFGPNLLIDDISKIVELTELCDKFGLDTISCGNVVGLAFKLFEKGIINLTNVAGLKLSWGNAESVEELIHLIAYRKGIGDVMAKGAKAFASYFRVEDEAIQVNGLEVPGHDPRGSSGMALVYATSPRGACHNKSDYFLVDWGQVDESIGLQYYSRQAGAEKAQNIARHQDYRSVFDSLVMCLFSNITSASLVDLVSTCTGNNYSLNELLKVGERTWNLKRCINIRMGLDLRNEKLPGPLMEPLSDGGSSGFQIPFDEMLEAYYLARDWQRGTGLPSKKKLDELKLFEQEMEFYK